ncbi:hypothetical protein [Bacillus sp. 7894-2]|uniref:hypothetical protein n=1 Tax=Bacillus sp. 7894-2 TaxID=2021695 RepID=UPI000BA5E0A7|nr:hypothetical protein [Bacillus sp. 7894-2]PAE24743.1 hypothetical protein CHI10_11490 [Bacillus sp. 7894-2]
MLVEPTKYCEECREYHPYTFFEGRYLNICKILKWAEGSINNAFRRSQKTNKLRKINGEEPLPFSITSWDLLDLWQDQNGQCFYTGLDFFPPWLDKYEDKEGMYTPSIDRLDNELGYQLNNIVLASRYINTIKNDKSLEQFLAELEDSAYISVQVISRIKSFFYKERFNPEIFLLDRASYFNIMLKKLI